MQQSWWKPSTSLAQARDNDQSSYPSYCEKPYSMNPAKCTPNREAGEGPVTAQAANEQQPRQDEEKPDQQDSTSYIWQVYSP